LIAAKYYVFLGLSYLTTGLVVSAPTSPVLATSVPEPQQFSIDKAIHEAALEHEVDPALIRSIIAAESSFEPDAESAAGAVGYMQIMPDTAEELGYDASDKEQNIRAGSKYLAVLIDKYKGARNGLQRAIAAYNAGPATVDRYKGIPPFRETRKYVKRVLQFRSEFAAAEQPEMSEGL
jgi:soluble lytic murein transglycosylase-like protein